MGQSKPARLAFQQVSGFFRSQPCGSLVIAKGALTVFAKILPRHPSNSNLINEQAATFHSICLFFRPPRNGKKDVHFRPPVVTMVCLVHAASF